MKDKEDKKTYTYGTISPSISKPDYTPLDVNGALKEDDILEDEFDKPRVNTREGIRLTSVIPAAEGTNAHFVTLDDNIIQLRVICWGTQTHPNSKNTDDRSDCLVGFCLLPTKPELVSVLEFEKFVCYGYPGESSVIIDQRIKGVLDIFRRNLGRIT